MTFSKYHKSFYKISKKKTKIGLVVSKHTSCFLEGGGKREFGWNFKRFKEGIKEIKLFLEHQQSIFNFKL